MGSGKEKNELKRGKIKDGNHTDIVFIDFLPLYGNGLMDAAASWTRGTRPAVVFGSGTSGPGLRRRLLGHMWLRACRSEAATAHGHGQGWNQQCPRTEFVPFTATVVPIVGGGRSRGKASSRQRWWPRPAHQAYSAGACPRQFGRSGACPCKLAAGLARARPVVAALACALLVAAALACGLRPHVPSRQAAAARPSQGPTTKKVARARRGDVVAVCVYPAAAVVACLPYGRALDLDGGGTLTAEDRGDGRRPSDATQQKPFVPSRKG